MSGNIRNDRSSFGSHPETVETRPIISPFTSIPPVSDTQPSKLKIKNKKNAPSLGPLLGIYRGKRLSSSGWFLLIIFGFLGIISAVLFTTWQYLLYGQYYGFPASDQWNRSWIYITGFIILVFAGMVVYQWNRSSRFIYLHQNGIRFQTGISKRRIILFDQISGIASDNIQEQFLGIKWRNIQKITIILKDGKKLLFDQKYKNILDFTQRVKNLVYPLLAPSIFNQYHSGKWLIFGVVRASQSGVNVNGKEILWEDITNVSIETGQLHIVYVDQVTDRKTKQQHIRIPVYKIPNLEIFLQLIPTGLSI